ncbi:hypothetical protein RND81_09G007200 [Saponaria officinalis]|uniref:Bet v I/Major latex protein domain-containing protein n=1 Tax=Saponaria officinalis TaxID=3572 RepID=A0AAW1IH71_SAPOF
MGLNGKLEVEVDIKSCGNAFYEFFMRNPHHISNISPHNIHVVAAHEGDFGLPGSVIYWNYSLDGKKCHAKEVVEAVDEANKRARFKVVEGDPLKDYKSLTTTVHVIPNNIGGVSVVKWMIEFEKTTDDGPYPTNMIDLCISVTKNIENHHLKP